MSLVSPCLGCPHYKEVEDCFKRLEAILKSQDQMLKTLASDFCNYLNELLKIDRRAVQELLNVRAVYNASNPIIPSVRDGDQIKIGLLGIINGFLLRHGDELIMAVRDASGELKEFQTITVKEASQKDKMFKDGRMWLKIYEGENEQEERKK